MADLKLVGNAMFYKKSDWVNVPDEEKESCFFLSSIPCIPVRQVNLAVFVS
jgi:hypothetical protein